MEITDEKGVPLAATFETDYRYTGGKDEFISKFYIIFVFQNFSIIFTKNSQKIHIQFLRRSSFYNYLRTFVLFR